MNYLFNFLYLSKMTVERRKSKKNEKNELIITVKDWATQAIGSLSPEELIAFLWGEVPKLLISLISKIDDEDWGIYMKRLICRAIISDLEHFLDDMETEEDDDKDEDEDND